MSFWAQPTVAAKMQVAAPTKVTTCIATGDVLNIGERRQTMNTPAVTIVAAWIRALTGVGPSIASGNQVWRPICADFPIAPTNRRMQEIVIDGTCQPRKLIVVPTAPGTLPNTVS